LTLRSNGKGEEGEDEGALKKARDVEAEGLIGILVKEGGGRGEDMAACKPLPLLNTITPCLCPLCRMSTKSLNIVGVGVAPLKIPLCLGVVSKKSGEVGEGIISRPRLLSAPITIGGSFRTSKPDIFRRPLNCLLVRADRDASSWVGVPIRAFTEYRPASEMAL
jgi:hypothetical protein